MAFEDEETGAIDTGESYTPPAPGEDNSGFGPVIPTEEDNSGFGPAASGAPAASGMTANPAQDSTGPNGPIARNLRAFPGNVKRIASYLMGEGASDPQALQAAAAGVDPQGQMSADDRNVLAVQQAAQTQGPEAAWKLVQANRVAYNAKQAFAYTAMNGTAQKRPDIAAAVDAANQAASHVLDGSTAKFALGQGGITATVTEPGGQPQTFTLSPDAFRRYLNVGGAGQYDRVQQTGVAKTLASLARGGGQGQDRISQNRPLPGPQQAPEEGGAIATNDDGSPYVPPEPKTTYGRTPSTMNLSGNDDIRPIAKTAQEATDYGDELEARAMRMFPSASQEQQRNQWMAAEEQRQQAAQNKVEVARETGLYRQGAAEATGRSRENVAKTNAEASIKNTDTKGSNYRYASDNKRAAEESRNNQRREHEAGVDARGRLESARKSIATKRMTGEKLTPEEEALEKQLAAGGAASATPGARSPAPQQAPQQRGALQPKDQQALAWANANPNDPRAAKIKAQLGVR